LVAQIDRHPIVPIRDAHILGTVTIIIRGVVDEHADGSVLAAGAGDRRLKHVDVLQIALNKSWWAMSAGLHTFDQGHGGSGLYVDKGYLCVLGTEMLDDALTDS
jgi:hypothetical protein